MRLHIASDHAGLELKQLLAERLRSGGHQVVDHGAAHYDPLDDYPAFCLRAAEAVASDPDSFGIVLGGSGNGEQIAANKVAGVRAVLAWSRTTAALGREHNDANVIAIGARMHSREEAAGFVDTFLSTQFSADDRHSRRIAMLSSYERSRELPPLA